MTLLKWTLLLGMLLAALDITPAFADTETVRITAINASAPVASPLVIDVHPGDAVAISADLFKLGGDCASAEGCRENRPPAEFIWSSDAHPNDDCNPSRDGDCLSNSGFQLHGDGVYFHVPPEMGNQIVVSVTHKQFTNVSDQLLLRNARGSAVAEAPSTPATVAPTVALSGMGRWVDISGERFWAPPVTTVEWVPYRHGYWNWVASQGWTWVSYDPWGWYTDHYGVWRHHVTFGWVWAPFAQPVYRPSTVSWVSVNGAIGWVPYYRGYVAGYRFGLHEGFNDGYGTSIAVSVHLPGFTVVAERDFLRTNLAEVHQARLDAAMLRSARFEDRLGDRDPVRSRQWVEARVGRPVPITPFRPAPVPVRGGAFHPRSIPASAPRPEPRFASRGNVATPPPRFHERPAPVRIGGRSAGAPHPMPTRSDGGAHPGPRGHRR